MNVAELMRDVAAAMQANGPATRYMQLAHDAQALADMVSWAAGMIDAEGKLNNHLTTLQQGLRQRHDQAPEAGLAALHDALGDLRNAIARHDRDFEITHADDEDEDS